MKLAVDVSNVVLGRRHRLQTSDDMAVWILELFGGEREGDWEEWTGKRLRTM